MHALKALRSLRAVAERFQVRHARRAPALTALFVQRPLLVIVRAVQGLQAQFESFRDRV